MFGSLIEKAKELITTIRERRIKHSLSIIDEVVERYMILNANGEHKLTKEEVYNYMFDYSTPSFLYSGYCIGDQGKMVNCTPNAIRFALTRLGYRENIPHVRGYKLNHRLAMVTVTMDPSVPTKEINDRIEKIVVQLGIINDIWSECWSDYLVNKTGEIKGF